MPRPAIPCSRCGTPRTPGRGSLAAGALVCRPCRTAARNGTASPLKTCQHPGCGKRPHAQALCSTHYERQRTGATPPPVTTCTDCGLTYRPRNTRQRFCSTRCSDHHRDSRRQRRHRKHFTTVWTRDNGTCGLCHTPINPDLTFPHRYSATLDHVLPRNHGGTDDLHNLRLAHLTCNAARHDTLDT